MEIICALLVFLLSKVKGVVKSKKRPPVACSPKGGAGCAYGFAAMQASTSVSANTLKILKHYSGS